jgi:acyl-coenzyme A thioesterase PaaI-like protein
MRWLDDGRLALDIRPELINPGGRLLGPVGFALVDYSMGAELWEHLDGPRVIATTNISMNFMDSATDGTVICTSRVDRMTRRLAWLTSDVVHEDGRTLYTAIGTFAILDPGRASDLPSG